MRYKNEVRNRNSKFGQGSPKALPHCRPRFESVPEEAVRAEEDAVVVLELDLALDRISVDKGLAPVDRLDVDLAYTE